ncbi:hypothetical protein FJ426_03490 [Mesorhizobium sp. B2-6-4]|nr:hypothetical protein FJ426_03490 [Mesorhizobium sp. B2-6-4]
MLQLGAPSTANQTRKPQRLTPLEHPSTVSALRADPPSPTRGEGKPPQRRRFSATLAIAESSDNSVLRPVYGEKMAR